MKGNDLNRRTQEFEVAVIEYSRGFSNTLTGSVIGRQLVKAATSVGANFRESELAASRRDFAHKISLAEKECAEIPGR